MLDKFTMIPSLSRRTFVRMSAGTAAVAYAAPSWAQADPQPVIYKKALPISDPACRYPGFNPRSETIDGIRVDYDVAVKLRDGVTIYTDIYRPEGASDIPAIVAYSPYGKQPSPRHPLGVPEGKVSNMAKMEGPDPAYWCKQGYAVINPDARGAYSSEGDMQFWGRQEGKDVADLIEFIARLPWCNGKLGMAGNSWLAISQWFAAAERPASLAAIAPWEGFDDYYRNSAFPGGIPETRFVSGVTNRQCGPGRVPDMPEMIRKYPLMGPFWQDKIAAVEKIAVPAYVVNTFNHFHSSGTMDAFRRMGSKDKWLRVTNDFEWSDFYDENNTADLRRFFDRYLKGIRNNWEETPRVRLSVTNPGGEVVVNRTETEFPLARQKFRKLYLAAGDRLEEQAASASAQVRYDAANGEVRFSTTFAKRTEITGYMKLRLWVEAQGTSDMDLFVYVRKLSAEGKFMPALIVGQPHPGAQGWMRVSHRELDPRRSTPSEPYQTHRREQLLAANEIVPVDIGIWPTAMIWEAGQKLEVVVAGRFMRDPNWFEKFVFETRNKGQHVLHIGGRFDSHLLVPVI